MLVAYRDGFTDDTTLQPIAWKTVTPSTSIDLMIKGSYSITVVCMLDSNTVLTWQALHTVEDDKASDTADPTLQTPCQAAAPARNTITGKLAQKGTVHLGDAEAQTTATAPFSFALQVPNGTFDLVATTSNDDPSMNKTLIQRPPTVVNGAADLGTIDASTGTAQVPLAMLLLSNPPNPAKSTETVAATVEVTTKNNSAPATISSANYNLTDKKITVFALPKAALGTGDVQTTTFTGSDTDDTDDGTVKDPITMASKDIKTSTSRSITLPLAVGDDTSTGKTPFALPASIAPPGWGNDKNRLSVALPALPALDDLTVEVTGQAMGAPGITVKQQINITASYFADTSLARPVFDTDINGATFQTGWKIDFSQPYSRTVTTERDVFNKGVFVDHESSQFSEMVTPHQDKP